MLNQKLCKQQSAKCQYDSKLFRMDKYQGSVVKYQSSIFIRSDHRNFHIESDWIIMHPVYYLVFNTDQDQLF